jgi:hypothetical protein
MACRNEVVAKILALASVHAGTVARYGHIAPDAPTIDIV